MVIRNVYKKIQPTNLFMEWYMTVNNLKFVNQSVTPV